VVTLREVTGDPEELAALQRILESDEDFALRVTGHPPGPADAQSTLMFVPEGRSPDDETVYLGLLLIDRAHQGKGIGAAACQALERDLLPRWPWARRLRLSVVRTNDQVLGFWRRLGFTETGELRPWRTTSSRRRRS
jgi:uncharacterized protein